MFACGPLLLIATAVLGWGRRAGAEFTQDLVVIYFAGVLWRSGGNPYEGGSLPALIEAHGVTVADGAFAYPPQIAPFAMLLSLGELQHVRAIVTAANFVSLGVIAWLSARIARSVAGRDVSFLAIAFIVLVLFGNPITSTSVYLGQTSIIVTALIMAGFVLAGAGDNPRAGVLLGLASFKPTLSLLPALYWVLQRRIVLVCTIGAVSLALAAYALLLHGPDAVIAGWLESIAEYRTTRVNRLGDRDVTGLQSLLSAAGIPAPDLLPLGVLSVVAVWWYRERFHLYESFALIVCCGSLFLFGHSYDFVALAVPFAVLVPIAGRTNGRLLAGLGLLAMLCVPARLPDALGIDVLSHWRNLVVLGCALWIAFDRSLPKRAARQQPRDALPEAAE